LAGLEGCLAGCPSGREAVGLTISAAITIDAANTASNFIWYQSWASSLPQAILITGACYPHGMLQVVPDRGGCDNGAGFP